MIKQIEGYRPMSGARCRTCGALLEKNDEWNHVRCPLRYSHPHMRQSAEFWHHEINQQRNERDGLNTQA